MVSSSHGNIAKNTLYLYLRMFLTMIVSLYTSRVVLNVLGAEDFGTYGLVGGVVSMFSFLNMAASGATTRFLTYEMGRGKDGRLSDTFSTSFILHALIAIAIAILVGTIGLWFLWSKLVIPDGRMHAANIVLLCSVISMAVTVTQEPYNAAVIAHEHFNVYAYVEILNVSLELGIVYLLLLGDIDKLILYSILQLSATFIIAFIYRIYCLRHFEECRLHWIWDKKLILPMISYSGWDLFGTVSYTAKSQGTAFLINMFFGVVFNAASSIASTVEGTLVGFSMNILSAFRPQIVKQYSSGNRNESSNLIYLGAKYSTFLLVILAIPFFFEMDYIMRLWLVNPPDYASLFCKIMLISGCLNMPSCAVYFGITATGKMGLVSILSSIGNIVQLFLLWLIFELGFPVYSAYYLGIFFVLYSLTVRSLPLQNYMREYNYMTLIKKTFLPLVPFVVIVVCCVYPIVIYLEDNFFRCVLVFSVSLLGSLLTLYLLILSKKEKQLAKDFVHTKTKSLFGHYKQ